MKTLILNNADVNIQDNEGCTALIEGTLFNLYLNCLFKYLFNNLASQNGHTKIVQMLKNAGAE